MFVHLYQLLRNNPIAAVAIVIATGAVGVTISRFLPEFQPPPTIQTASPMAESPKTTSSSMPNASLTSEVKSANTILVDVQGAVSHPGVYSLSSSARLSDALSAAGELSNNADTLWVGRNLNRATKIHDGDKIYVPKKGEVREPFTINSSLVPIPTTNTQILGLATQVPSSIDSTTSTIGPTSSPTPHKVSLNQASLSELDALPGIGEKRAQDIIKGRPYTQIEQLLQRKIVTQSVYKKILPEIEL